VNRTTQHLVAQELRRLALGDEPEHAEAVATYVELLCRWGRRLNLTGRANPESVVQRQLPDGLVLARELRALAAAGPIADVGSGAGLPGLVVALLCPGETVHLVEPNGRRCAFLRTAAHELGLTVHVVQSRLEDAALPPARVLCSRATWPLPQWLERASHVAAADAVVVAFAAREDSLPLPPAGLALVRTSRYELVDGTPRLIAWYTAS
jgi:16S rRNA (guanine527-N7)-methyltransferase